MARRDLEEEDKDQTSWIVKLWVAHVLLVVGGQERGAQRRGGLDDEGAKPGLAAW